MNKEVSVALGLLAMLMPLFGAVIGVFRYHRNGKHIREEMERQYSEAQKKGGISSLYYKNTGKRTFSRTFGTPMFIGFALGLVLLWVIFKMI